MSVLRRTKAIGDGNDRRLTARASARARSRPRVAFSKSRRAAGSDVLVRLSQRVGVETSYVDTSGCRQTASHETLKAVLKLWGYSVENSSEIRQALSDEELRCWQAGVEPVTVVWDGRPTSVQLRFRSALESEKWECRIQLENGPSQRVAFEPARLRTVSRAELEGQSFVAKEFLLPPLTIGYHQLQMEVRGRVFRSLLISAPTRSYSPPSPKRTWGLFLPMYAAHSKESWGAGNLGDWRRLASWAAAQGAHMVSTLPLLAGFFDERICEPSPYSPVSRLFWNEFYLDIPAIPEFARCKPAQKLVASNSFQRKLNSFRQSKFVNYPAEMALRRRVLEQLAGFFTKTKTDSARQKAFQRFLQERPLTEDYARFRAACEQSAIAWRYWEPRMQYGRLEPGDYSESSKLYHLYAQWIAQEQMSQLPGPDLYLDLPLGVHPDGFDAWKERHLFVLRASVGAPPDMFFSKGQDWGFPPLHPERVRESGYAYVLDYLRVQMRQAHTLRIDHVMGLHRLFWIPQGCPAGQGAYVRYAADELLAILSLESHRHKTVIVGENLGTVPREVNESMARHGLRQMYVVQFEAQPDPKQALRLPPSAAVASLDTHDTPMFAAYWDGLDIADRGALGLLSKRQQSEQREEREQLKAAVLEFLARQGCLAAGDVDVKQVLTACLRWLRSSPAETVLINLEDLWTERRPQNLPGTSVERPNWRRKSKLRVEEIEASDELREVLRLLNKSGA